MQRAGERDHRENEDQAEIQNHVFDDDLLQDHQEHVKLFWYAAEEDKVGHPAEQKDHRRSLKVGLPAVCAGVPVVPCEERDAERQQREDMETGKQHPHQPRLGSSSYQRRNAALPGGVVVAVEKIDPGVPESQHHAVHDAPGE